MCDANSNVTTSSTSLPGGLTDAINTASAGAVKAYNAGNPAASIGPAPVAGLNSFQTQAANTTAGVAGYAPQQVSTGYAPQQVSAGSVTQFGSPSVTGDQIAAQMNPYTSSVIGTSLDQLNRQLAQTNQTASGQAAQAGAFGGDRAAIVQTENARNANQIAAQTIAGLNSSNYTQASAAAQQNATRALTAGTAQAQLDANVGQGNQYAGIQAANLNSSNERANQSAGLQGQQLNLSAANQEGALGAQFRQASQDNLNSNYSQAYSNAFYPITSVSTLAGQLGALAGAAPKTTTTVAPGQSTTGQLAGLGTAALGLNTLVPGGIASGLKSLFGGGSGLSAENLTNSSNLGAVANASDAQFLADGQDFYNTLSDGSGFFARGGIVGYADGGNVQAPMPGMVFDPATGTYVQAPSAMGAAKDWLQGAQIATAPTRLTVQAPTSDPDATVPAGPAATANLGLGAAALPSPALGGLQAAADTDPSSNAVEQALAVNPAAIVGGALPPGQGPSGQEIPIDQMPPPASTGVAAAARPEFSDQAFPQPQGGIADAAPSQPPTRMDRSSNPSSPIPTGGFGVNSTATPNGATVADSAPAASQPGSPLGSDWSDNKLGMTLLNAGLGMMASQSHTALGAIGDGGLAGARSLSTFEANRAAQMKNDLTQATLPSTLQALTASGQQSGVSDPGQAEVLRLRTLQSRYVATGDGRGASEIGKQLLEIAKDGRVTGADGRVYMVPNAQQLAFGVNSSKELAGVPAKSMLANQAMQNTMAVDDHSTSNKVAASNAEQAGAAAGAEPIQMTIQDANGNPTSVVIPRSQWRAQNIAANPGASAVGADQYLSALKQRENPGGNPAQQNTAGSNAVGNGQFMPNTWLPLFKASYPDAASKMSDAQILQLRTNGSVSDDMTLRYGQQNAGRLAANGLQPTAAAVGLAHQFGPDGALKIANAPAGTPVNVALGVSPDSPLITQNRLGGVTAGQLAGQMARNYGTGMVALPSNGPPGTPPGTMQGAPYLSPEQKTLESKRGDMAAQIVEAGQKAPDTLSRLDVLQNAFNSFRPGVTGPARAQASKVITDLFQSAGMTPPDWATTGATASDTIVKEGGQLTAAMTRSLGSREAASVFNSIREFTPNLSMSNGGFQVVVNSLRQGVLRDQDMANYQEQWLADPKNHGSTAGMSTAFNNERPIETYASRVTPYPMPNSAKAAKDGVIYKLPDGRGAEWSASTQTFNPIQGQAS